MRRAVLLHRQQRFLLPAVTLLANLAEDPNAQKKMLKRVRGGRCRCRLRHPVCVIPACATWQSPGRRACVISPPSVRDRPQELPALLVALLGFPCVELATAVLDLLRRMAIYTVRTPGA